jgi:LEA14-like dessication related protein
VSLANISVQEIKGFETVFQIDLRIFNTNDINLVIKAIDCELEVNNRQFASGITNAKTEIPPYSTDTIPVTVYSSVIDVARGVFGLRNAEKLRYKIEGRVHLASDFSLPAVVPFESAGEFFLQGDSDSISSERTIKQGGDDESKD